MLRLRKGAAHFDTMANVASTKLGQGDYTLGTLQHKHDPHTYDPHSKSTVGTAAAASCGVYLQNIPVTCILYLHEHGTHLRSGPAKG
jgi:hypothetical protein